MRSRRLHWLSLEGLLALGFGSLIVGGVVSALLALSAWRVADTSFDVYEKQDAPVALHAFDGVAAWLRVRRFEESILLHPAGSAAAAEATARDVSQWKTATDDVRNYLTLIRQLAGKKDRGIMAQLPELEAALVRYTTGFSSITDLAVRLRVDSGPDAARRGMPPGEYARMTNDLEAKRRDVLRTAAVLDAGLERLKRDALEHVHGNLLATGRHIVGAAMTAALVALVAVLFGAAIAVVVARRIRAAAQRVIGFAAHVAAGRFQTRLDRVDGGEFGALESALNTMADRLQQHDEFMNRQARTLESSSERIALLSEMTGLLQAAVNIDEATDISACHLGQMQLARGGALYLYNESRSQLDAIARWGEVSAPASFAPASCWALRRGRPYGFGETNSAVTCGHLPSEGDSMGSLCLPLVSSEGMLGLVHVAFDKRDPAARTEDAPFAMRLSEQLGLAFANLKLRETLHAKLIRDPLTKLFTRRVLEESLPLEIARARRANESVAVLMIDADHFKQFNDAHGHQAGDAALSALGKALSENCRAGDLACRYGGEEFTVVLPRTGREESARWAGRLLDRIRSMTISLDGVVFPSLTVSIGGSLYPDHGDDPATVLGMADQALYQAKHAGRDRVVIPANTAGEPQLLSA